jgi:dihydropyrimidinase
MRTRIANGTLVTATGAFAADVLVNGERISAVGTALDGDVDRLVDASGCYVLPGGVDPHTHLDLPVGHGVVSSDDFETGTIAAACGGTTTIIDFATQARGGHLEEAFGTWRGKADGRAVIDYGLHMIVADWNPGVAREMDALVAAGVSSFKLFTAYPDRLMLDDGAIFEVMQRCRDNGGLVLVHAENGPVIDALVRQALAAGRTAPRHHAQTRPAELEAEAVHRLCVLARLASAPLYVVHVSSDLAAAEIAAARGRGQHVIGETCPQYLCLDDSAYGEEGFDGARFVMSPPLRPRHMQAGLWAALADGTLETVGTDHCPFLLTDKARGRDDFSKIPNGAPGIEYRLVLLHDAGVRQGRLSLTRWVDAVSTAPARAFGLYPRKGAIAPGCDADLVIFDPAATHVISARTHHMRVDYSPYEGRQVQGRVRTVFSRGEAIVEDGAFKGRKGRGRFLERARFEWSAVQPEG